MTASAKSSTATETQYFNLNTTGIGYLSNIRQVSGEKGSFTCAVINALSGPTDKTSYTRFDVTVAGKDTVDLVNRCQKAVDEEQQVLIGFVLSGLSAETFTLKSGEHAGEDRIALRSRLIKIDFIKIGKETVYKAEKPTSTTPPAQSGTQQQKQYATNSF
ncbi:STY4534 family ICE replication protein [Dickeya dadantii]|uniref:STY4534 family ICE replication protein n=1 Tax=Dickeya dadantii TaxID=204038 RepID=UPI0021DB6613|nr:STY4534 family ICE replication protein [Dickeya dadantii]